MTDGNGAAIGDGGGGGHFERFNSFVANGWAGVVGKAASTMWLAYLKHADNATGISYPGNETLKQAMRYSSTRHFARLRGVLVAHRLVDVIDAGGGRARPCKVRVLVPGAAPWKHSHGGSVLFEDAQTLPRRARKHSHGARANTPTARAPYKEELPKELPKELPNVSAAGAAAAKPRSRKEKKRKLTDEQLTAWREFTDHWKFVLWPKYHDGEVYDFKSVDGSKSLDVMRDPRFRFNAGLAKACAELFMRDPEIYGNWDHTMSRFHQKRGWYLRLHMRRLREGNSHVITTANAPDVRADAVDDYAIPAGRPRAARPGEGAGGPRPGAAAAG